MEHPKILHNGGMVHTTNSEGKPIHSTEQGIKNFHDWFGKSKVVDEHGRPQVVYHGTDKDVETFNPGVSWVSTKPELANAYADYRSKVDKNTPNLIPTYVKSETPFDATKLPKGGNTIGTFYSQIAKQSSNNVMSGLKQNLDKTKDAALKIGNKKEFDVKDFWHNTHENFGDSTAINDSLKLAGFDSIKHKEDGHDTYGILHSNNLKSAIGNSGNFSTKSDKLVESFKEYCKRINSNT